MNHQLGKLTEAVETLKSESKEHGKKLDRLSHIIYSAGVVGTVLLAIGVWLLNKIADVVIAKLNAPPLH